MTELFFCSIIRGIHAPTEKMTSKEDMFSCLRKFSSLGCYSQQRSAKKNVSTQKFDKVDKEFKCECKCNPIAQKKRKNRDQKTKTCSLSTPFSCFTSFYCFTLFSCCMAIYCFVYLTIICNYK